MFLVSWMLLPKILKKEREGNVISTPLRWWVFPKPGCRSALCQLPGFILLLPLNLYLVTPPPPPPLGPRRLCYLWLSWALPKETPADACPACSWDHVVASRCSVCRRHAHHGQCEALCSAACGEPPSLWRCRSEVSVQTHAGKDKCSCRWTVSEEPTKVECFTEDRVNRVISESFMGKEMLKWDAWARNRTVWAQWCSKAVFFVLLPVPQKENPVSCPR